MAKRLNMKGFWKLLVKSGKGFIEDKVVKLSAALAFYTIFSLGPMMIVILYLADIFWGRAAVEGSLFEQLRGLLGTDAARQVQEVIQNASMSGKSTFTAVIGFITLLIGATTVFAEIQDSINMIWNLKTKAERGWLKMIVDRLLSFSIIVSLGFLLLVSLVINGLVEIFMRQLQEVFPNVAVVALYIINLLVTFIIVSSLFAIIFKVLPDAQIKWRNVFVGSMFTAFLFIIGKFGITYYVSTSDLGTTYGAAGSLVVLLLWVYYSSFILYFGAEFTKAYASRYGEPIHPSQYAVWVKQVEVEEGTGTLQNQEKKKDNENKNTGDNVKVT
jgi:membrane protein